MHVDCNMRVILSKAPLHPIVATTPMDLLHVDFTMVEATLELNRLPKVSNTPGGSGPFHEAYYVICDPGSNSKNSC